jgi:probable addiction module antidote protein
MDQELKNMIEKTGSFQEYLINSLTDPQEAEAYLNVALEEYQEDGDSEMFLLALKNVAQAQGGMSKLAGKTKLNRQHLYHALSAKGNPSLATLTEIIHKLGFQLSIQRAKIAA